MRGDRKPSALAISLAVQAALLAQKEGRNVELARPSEDDYDRLREYCQADVNDEILRAHHLREAMREADAGESELFYGSRADRRRAKKTDRRFKL